MKQLLLAFTTLFSLNSHAFAPELTITTESKFTITSPDAARKFEDTLLMTEGFLKRFNPADATVKKKVVVGNTFDYVVVKKFLGIPTEAQITGSLTFERVATGCLPTEDGYLGTFEFTGEQVIVDNIEALKMLICSLEKTPSTLSVRTKNTLYYKGEKLGYIAEKFVTSVIKDQVEAINSAMKAEVSAKSFFISSSILNGSK